MGVEQTKLSAAFDGAHAKLRVRGRMGRNLRSVSIEDGGHIMRVVETRPNLSAPFRPSVARPIARAFHVLQPA